MAVKSSFGSWDGRPTYVSHVFNDLVSVSMVGYARWDSFFLDELLLPSVACVCVWFVCFTGRTAKGSRERGPVFNCIFVPVGYCRMSEFDKTHPMG